MEEQQEPATNSIAIEGGEKTNHSRRFIIGGVIFGLVLFAFYAGYQKGKYGTAMTEAPIAPNEASFRGTAEGQDASIDFSLFWKVWNLLKDKYVEQESLDAKVLFYGAIKGMLAATGDPYTTFFDPKENKEFKEELSQSFDGIGAEMQMKDGILTVVAPLDSSPAEKAGIRAGDKVLKINGESTENLDLQEAVDKIRGPRGTEVVLSLFHPDEDELREVSVQRDVIMVKSVTVEMRDSIAVIRITRFGEETTDEFENAVAEARKQSARGILLDVRNNPGGFLDAAVDLGGYFLPPGSVVVMEEDAKKDRKSLKTHGNNIFGNLPVVILINEGSASASEILAAGIRENRSDVILVGEKSFGKGSVQELIPTSSNTSVKITVARWLTPNGNQINKVGINPDVEVKLTREDIKADRDPQFDRALEILREKLPGN